MSLPRSRLLSASIALAAAISATTALATAPSIVNETVVPPGDTALTRSVTVSADPLEEANGSPGLPGTRGANTYLWLDRNHLDAVAENVAVTADGAYGGAGWWLNNKRFSLYAVRGGTGVPLSTRLMPAAEFQIPVDADGASTFTATARGESLLVLSAPGSEVLRSDWYTPPLVGYKCGISDNAITFAGGGGNPAGGAGEVRVYDGPTKAIRFIKPLTAPPEGLCVSEDGTVVASNVRTYVKVWDAMTGALRDSIPIVGETQTPAVLSGDGAYLVTGGFYKTVKLYHWDGSHYVGDWSHNIPGTTWVTTLAISRDGSTIVAGTWTNGTLMGGKVVVYDRSSATPLWTDSGYGDEVQSVSVSGDGRMIAAGSWGRSGGTYGNVINVYDRSSVIPVQTIGDDAIAGVGSCLAVDLSRNGAYLLAGGKAVHAREWGHGGWVMAIEVPLPAAVEAGSGRPSIRLAAMPNPFSGMLRIESAGTVRILSADGRVIRSLAGPTWDGRDDEGRPMPAGAYFVRDADPRTQPIRVVRIR